MAESDTASTASNSASIEAEDIELLQPYMYEPEYSEDEIPVSSQDRQFEDSNVERMTTTNW